MRSKVAAIGIGGWIMIVLTEKDLLRLKEMGLLLALMNSTCEFWLTPDYCSSDPKLGKVHMARSTRESKFIHHTLIWSFIQIPFLYRYGDQIVAIKVLNRGTSPEEKSTLEGRFIREVNMMSRVKHENLVQVKKDTPHPKFKLKIETELSVRLSTVHWSL